jgi:hypothetical protein
MLWWITQLVMWSRPSANTWKQQQQQRHHQQQQQQQEQGAQSRQYWLPAVQAPLPLLPAKAAAAGISWTSG